MDVCCLEVEDVEEGRVVHGGRGRRHGDAQGRGGQAVGEGGVREDAGAGLGERSLRKIWRSTTHPISVSRLTVSVSTCSLL